MIDRLRRARAASLPAVILITAACTPGVGSSDIVVTEAWLRPAPSAGGTTALYFEIENRQSVGDRLLGADSPGARSIEMHETTWEGDVARMRRLTAIELPRRGSVSVAPGGLHLMLVGLREALEAGERVPVTLYFETAGEVRIEAEVRQP